jgi:hypothetical protein
MKWEEIWNSKWETFSHIEQIRETLPDWKGLWGNFSYVQKAIENWLRGILHGTADRNENPTIFPWGFMIKSEISSKPINTGVMSYGYKIQQFLGRVFLHLW